MEVLVKQIGYNLAGPHGAMGTASDSRPSQAIYFIFPLSLIQEGHLLSVTGKSLVNRLIGGLILPRNSVVSL